jgi:transaldolase
MTSTNHLLEIKEYGQSIWMDNLTRDLIQSGELKDMVENKGICGITSNPAIFEKAIAGNVIYYADIESCVRASLPTYKIYESLVFADIRNACDILRPVYEASNKLDGYVSIEVPAHNTEATIAAAHRYYQEIGRENVMIKIPGTEAGLAAVEEVIAAGINVNVTLLFSVSSYVNSAIAYIRGLEARVKEDKDISNIACVASFFLSRIDSNIDGKIDGKLEKGVDDIASKAKLKAVKGKVAIANAKIAYQEYKKISQSDGWQAIDINSVMDELLVEGIDKFVKPFQSLMDSLENKIKVLSPV